MKFIVPNQVGYTFYMASSDGGASNDGIHKKILGSNVEVYEAQRQVTINKNLCGSDLTFNGSIFFLPGGNNL